MKTTTPGYGYNNNSNIETIGLDSNESWQDSIILYIAIRRISGWNLSELCMNALIQSNLRSIVLYLTDI